MKGKRFKILVIENNDIELIKIQERLIPEEVFDCRLPFDLPKEDQTNKARKSFMSELQLPVLEKTINPSDCKTEEERRLLETLNREDGLPDVIKTVTELIEDNYSELRLIVCDLELCHEEDAGIEIIKSIRSGDKFRKTLKDKKWFYLNIPIVILTHLEGKDPLKGLEGAERNSILIKKSDLYSDTEIKGVACSVFSRFITKMAENFDIFYNGNIKEYKVSLSFSSMNDIQHDNIIHHKEFIRIIKQYLYTKYKDRHVYYFEDDNTSCNLTEDIIDIYTENSEYVIVFISQDYNTDAKNITQREWEAIRAGHENSGWEKVIFVPIEKSMNNALYIKKQLDLDAFNEVFVGDFCDLREKFYQVISNGNQDSSKTISEYNKVCESIFNMVEEKIIPRIK